MIEILSTSGLATVQDLGRDRHYRHGVSIGGAMDRVALVLGNALLGNPDGAAAVEIPFFSFKVRFRAATEFALTGADCNADLDGAPVLPNWAKCARDGQILTLDAPKSGSYAYLSVAGGVDVPELLGSRSTHLRAVFGGLEGRTLREGDILAIGSPDALPPLPEGGFGAESPQQVFPSPDGMTDATPLRVLPAAEADHFDAESRRLFFATAWRISPQSGRSGYRLTGPTLDLADPLEMRSHGIVPGVIQVPTGGSPIVQTADSQTAGGYPKIATVIEADLWRLAQARIGSRLRFVETTYPEAVAALEELRAYVVKVRHLAKTVRGLER